MPREEHTLQFRIAEGSEGWCVEASLDEAAMGKTPLDLDWRFGDGDSARALELLQKGAGSDQDLRLVGSLLWSSLLGEGEVRERVRELWLRHRDDQELHVAVRLKVPPDFDDLPWEAAYDETTERFVGEHRRSAIVRDPWRDYGLHPIVTRKAQRVRMLIIAPRGSGLAVSTELRRLREALAPVLSLIEGAPSGSGPRELHENATVAEVSRALASSRWDIVHFIGHGRVNDRESASLRLVDENGEDAWQTQSAVSGLFNDTGVQLVVLNACATGRVSSSGGLAGLGPVLLANGIPAVVAMRHDIDDRVAIELASAFYEELFTGPSPGRVEPAVQRARGAIQRSFGATDPRAFVTPALFLAPGQGALFELVAPSAPSAPAALSAPAPFDLPASLVSAVRNGLCVPVVGPGLDAPRPRGGAGARSFLGALAAACGYPRKDEIALAESDGGGAELWVLQRVCQYFEVTQDRNRLTDAVLSASEGGSDPSPTLRALARWRVPGVVSTSFDRGLQRAFQAEQPSCRVLHRLDDAAPGDATHPLLVCLRGSIGDETSLVLTESDHEALLDRIVDLKGGVLSLVTAERNRTLLFLGVSPRDAWVRALARRLVPETIRRFCSVVFVGASTEVERALWESLHVKVKWIEEEPSAVVAELSRLAETRS